MTKNMKSFLAHAMAGALGATTLLCGVQVAGAQGYNDGPNESVIVHPNSNDYGQIESHQLLGRIDGEVNPTILTISEPVSYSDLDLSRDSDANELRLRVRDTAIDICSQLAARDVNMSEDADTNRRCVNQAIQSAMAQIPNNPMG